VSTQVSISEGATLTFYARNRTLLVRQGTKVRTYRIPQGDISHDEGTRHVAVFNIHGKLARDFVFATSLRAGDFARFLILASCDGTGIEF